MDWIDWKPRTFQILKWLFFALAALSFVGGFSAENLLDEASFVRAAIFFAIIAIFFHLEQHTSGKTDN